MSCFILSTKQINDTINFINHKVNVKEGGCASPLGMSFTSNYLLPKLGLNFTKEDMLHELSRYFQKINIESWNTRYPNDAIKTENIISEYRYHYKTISLAQFMKNLECIDYQCCEIENYDDSLFAKLIISLKTWGYRLMDGYEQASWAYS